LGKRPRAAPEGFHDFPVSASINFNSTLKYINRAGVQVSLNKKKKPSAFLLGTMSVVFQLTPFKSLKLFSFMYLCTDILSSVKTFLSF
jgi:hypothetical protein